MSLWQLCEAAVPIAVGIIVDRAIIPRSLPALIVLLFAFAALFTVLSLSYRFGARLLNACVHRESHALRVEIARRALTSPEALGGRAPGAVIALSTSDAERASLIFRQLALGGGAVAGIIGTAAWLLSTDVLVGLLVLIGVPLTLLLVAAPARRISQHSHAQQEAIGEASASAGDHMTGLRILAAIGGGPWAQRRYRAASERAARAGATTADAEGRVAGLGTGAVTLLLAVIVLAAGWRAVDGILAPGQLVAIVGAAAYLAGPMATLTNALASFARASGAAARIAEFLAVGEPGAGAPVAGQPAARPAALAG
ncbi:ABC transporter ATP-binding protein, partial [Brevibacterium sp. 5221]